MQRDEFVALIDSLSFDNNIRNLFLTGYDLGYNAGQLDQFTKVVDILNRENFATGIK